MTLVEDVIGYLEDDYPGGLPSDVELINGADSETTDGERSREGALARANLVTVKPASVSTTPIGTEYDQQRDESVNVRVEGLHEDQRGHVADYDDFRALYNDLKAAIDTNRTFPTTSTDTNYHSIIVENEADESSNFRDYYMATFDCRFSGFKEL